MAAEMIAKPVVAMALKAAQRFHGRGRSIENVFTLLFGCLRTKKLARCIDTLDPCDYQTKRPTIEVAQLLTFIFRTRTKKAESR